MPARTLNVPGSTASIGTNTLDVVRQNPSRFQVFALAAGRNIELLAQQIQEFRPEVAVIQEASDLDRLRAWLTDFGIPDRSFPELLTGPDALVRIAVAAQADTVMSSIVGVAGLPATW